MKNVALLIALLCLVAAPTFAQRAASGLNHEGPVAGLREDGSTAYQTTDPAGNDVWVIAEPIPKNLAALKLDVHTLQSSSDIESGDGYSATVPVYAVADEEYRSAHSN